MQKDCWQLVRGGGCKHPGLRLETSVRVPVPYVLDIPTHPKPPPSASPSHPASLSYLLSVLSTGSQPLLVHFQSTFSMFFVDLIISLLRNSDAPSAPPDS